MAHADTTTPPDGVRMDPVHICVHSLRYGENIHKEQTMSTLCTVATLHDNQSTILALLKAKWFELVEDAVFCLTDKEAIDLWAKIAEAYERHDWVFDEERTGLYFVIETERGVPFV